MYKGYNAKITFCLYCICNFLNGCPDLDLMDNYTFAFKIFQCFGNKENIVYHLVRTHTHTHTHTHKLTNKHTYTYTHTHTHTHTYTH